MGPHVRRAVRRFLVSGSIVAALMLGFAATHTAQAAGKWWETSTTNIYTIYPYWTDFTSKYPNTTLTTLTSQLDTLKSQGFNALMFQPINHGDGTQWGGLASLAHKSIGSNFGTVAQYQTLVSEAHRRGMKVLLFFNLGFASRDAPFFQNACEDYANGNDTEERDWFVFSETADPSALPPGAGPGNGWSWVWSDCADAYYLEKWGDGLPSYNWAHPDWREQARSIIRFWMDLGTDGMSFDAPAAYYGGPGAHISRATITENLTDVVNSYTNAPLGYPEGIGHGSDWISDYHWQGLEDYHFAAQWARPTPLANAILTHNPARLEGILNRYRDGAVAAGGIFWSAPSWGRLGIQPNLTPPQRALELATIASVGAVLDWHDTQDDPVFGFWNSWSATERQKVFDIQKAGRDHPALGAVGDRLKLATNNDNAYYAFKRTNKDGTQAALAVLNYTAEQQDITVNLAGSGIAPQTPTDLLNGGSGAPITSDSYTVTLPAYGYTFLGLPKAQGSGGLLQGGSANTPANTNLTTEGTDDWAHWGNGGTGDFNHKSGVTQKISNFTQMGPGSTAHFVDNAVNYSWSDGVPPTTSAANVDNAIYSGGEGSGFRIRVPADATQRTLKLYVGAWRERARVHAYLTDGSSLPYNDQYEAGDVSANKVYTLSYRAGSAGQYLIVEVSGHRTQPEPNHGNVTLQAATLSTPALGLSGSSVNTLASTSLSAEGTDDWAHWGRSGAGAFNHKSGVTQKISNYTKIGSGSVFQLTGNLVDYSWNGGTPTGSEAATATGIWTAGTGNGFRITAPASATRRTLKLYVGAWQARARIHASLSDGSSPAYTSFYDSSATSANKAFTLSYKAGSAGQTLTVDVTVDAPHVANGNVTLQGATLATPASGGALNGGSEYTPLGTHLSNGEPADWAHWGRNAVGDFNHKSGVPQQISNATQIGSTGTVARLTGNLVDYSWAGGTPTASQVGTRTGIYIAGTGKGFRVTAPASTAQRTLKLYVGGWQAYGRVQAYLSDGSAGPYTDYFESSAISANKVYSLTYRGASPGQTLTVDVTVETGHLPSGNVTLQAATLSDCSCASARDRAHWRQRGADKRCPHARRSKRGRCGTPRP